MRFKRSSLLTKILVLVLVVYATVTLVSLESQVAEMNAEAESLQGSIEKTPWMVWPQDGRHSQYRAYVGRLWRAAFGPQRSRKHAR